MDLGINNKLAVVTGAGRGLGEGICKTLASEGVKIIAASRNVKDLEKLIDELGGKKAGHSFISIDLSTNDGPSKLIKYVNQKSLHPNIIVNNVGGNLDYIDPLGPVDEWKKVMRINVEVALEINRSFIPNMQLKKWGRICHVSSISALENQGPPAYCAAKAALNAYVRSLGRYVSKDNVILTSIMPGAIFTKDGYWDLALQNRPDHVKNYLNDRMAIKRFGKVEEISNLVAFLCSDQASFCVGSALLADGGQGRSFFPSDF